MKIDHLSSWEQEEYVLNQRTPEMLRHLAECADCRADVGRLEHGVAIFRTTAVEWSAECLAARPRQLPTYNRGRLRVVALRWAVVAALPFVLLVLALFSFRPSSTVPPHTPSAISDDALLDQVDAQLSVAVPSSMESLTHLVSTGDGNASDAATSGRGSKHIVETN